MSLNRPLPLNVRPALLLDEDQRVDATAEEKALAKGMEEKSKEVAEAGAEVYVPA